jgi:hypothetical protein
MNLNSDVMKITEYMMQAAASVAFVMRRQCPRGLQVGVFERNPQRAAQIISGWFGERRAEFEEMRRRAKALAKPHALFDICRDLATLAPAADGTLRPKLAQA